MWWRFSFSRARLSAARLRARLSSSPDKARVTVSLPRWRWSSRPRPGRAGSGRLGAGAWRRGRRDGRDPRRARRGAAGCGGASASARRAASAASAAARCSAASSSALRLSSARRFSSSLCRPGRDPRGGALPRARPCALLRPRAADAPAVPCAAMMSSAADSAARRRGAARRGGRRRRLGRLGDGRRARALRRRRGFAGLAEDAALLDLDHDGVRAAMAEALLDLAGLDRALEAQRRPGAKLRFFGLVGHSIPSSQFVGRAGAATAGAPPSGPASGSVKACHRPSAWRHTRCRGGIGQGDMYHIVAPKCHRQDSARPREKSPPGAPRRRRPARAWSSLRLPSSPASAAWISSATLPDAAAARSARSR